MRNERFHQDTIGEWFRSLPTELDIQIPIALLREGSEVPEWYSYNHRCFDGVGALMNLLEKNGFSRIGSGASSKIVECKGLRRWWKLFLFAIKFRQQQKIFCSTPWRVEKVEVSNRDLPCGIAWVSFSKEFTDLLIAHTKSKNISVNSFLLSALNASISPSLLKSPKALRNWMMPVNLRGRLLLENIYGNHSMWLDAELKENESAEKVHDIVHSQLKGGIPWLNYLIATYILNKGMKMDLDAQPHHCGTQSNLGVWPGPDNVALNPSHSNDISAVLFVPPVQKSNLLSTGAISWCGKLGLALHVHPALTNSPDEIKTFLSAWVQLLQEQVGTHEIAGCVNFSSAEAVAGGVPENR